MPKYDFILQDMYLSFSSVSSFEQCKHGFKLSYIDGVERSGNFFSEYGSFHHSIMEKYFAGELNLWDLEDYYSDNYSRNITLSPPAFIKNAEENYYNKGLKFFSDFSFDKTDYEIISIEDYIKTEFDGVKLVIKPDLVLKEKSTGKVILVDFKTANPLKSNGKLDKAKIEGYLKQFYLYCYFLWHERNLSVDEIQIWFVTAGIVETVKFDPIKAQEVWKWFKSVSEKIMVEENWEANNKNTFYCSNLCSVAQFCKYKKEY